MERIAADFHVRIGRLDRAQSFRHPALGQFGHDGVRQQPLAAREPVAQAFEHGPHDGRDAGQDEDVLHLEAGRPADRVLDQVGALRRVRHAQARRVQLAGFVVALENPVRLRVEVSGRPKALATAAPVMSSWVGPIPPVVKT